MIMIPKASVATNNKPVVNRKLKHSLSIERVPRSRYLSPGLNREKPKDCIGFMSDLNMSEDDE